MEIYLIRHTTPAIEKGICYGHADIGVGSTFTEEANNIKQHIPPEINTVYSSPLSRCRRLATYLFPQHAIQYDERLIEMNFGDWEMQQWGIIDQELLQIWMKDYVNVSPPGGENYRQLYDRSVSFYKDLVAENKRAVVIAHAGVIRSILAYIKDIALTDSFSHFTIAYGCVLSIKKKGAAIEYTFL